MDDRNFENQFKQSIKVASSASAVNKTPPYSIVFPVIIAILALVILVESIALAVVVHNYFDLVNDVYQDPGQIYSIEDENDGDEIEYKLEETGELKDSNVQNNSMEQNDINEVDEDQ